MKSTLFSNLLQQSCLPKTSAKHKSNQPRYRNNLNNSTSGFTLLEVLVTIVIVGILSAIAAPSWLSFVDRQRLNKANDTVLAALREAQTKAKNTKFSYSVSFTTKDNEPKVFIHRHDVTPSDDNWYSLGRDSGVNTEKFLLGTNLEGSNTKKSGEPIYAAAFDADKPQTITFNYQGVLESTDGNPFDTGLKILLAIPKPDTPTEASDVKRCVIVETLIGGIRTAKDEDCE
jgi:prepilin-type N-terminal cleavage/methylation domain-containing protein